jgi:putative FmdB family regulatory protein
MPIYEYVCLGCHLKFEVFHRAAHNREKTSCPSCQASAGKVLSLFASFSKSPDGESTAIAGGGPSCASCSLPNCDTCG